jgi:segregation and condensation protein A
MLAPEISIANEAVPSTGDRVFTGHPVRVPRFEGPLDLLLYLINRDEIDIFDIPIERITAQFLEYLETLESLNIEVAGEFVVMAAQLMEIKSRMLLPRPELLAEEEEESGDPRAQLIARLVEYRRYKAVAEELRARAELQRYVFSRAGLTPANGNGNGNGNGHHERPFLMLGDVSAFDLWAAFQSVLDRVKEAPTGDEEVVRPRFTVAQKIAAIASRLRWSRDGLRFVELFADDVTRGEMIVTFLALLELVRLRRVRVVQEALFGEIWVYPGREAVEA